MHLVRLKILNKMMLRNDFSLRRKNCGEILALLRLLSNFSQLVVIQL